MQLFCQNCLNKLSVHLSTKLRGISCSDGLGSNVITEGWI